MPLALARPPYPSRICFSWIYFGLRGTAARPSLHPQPWAARVGEPGQGAGRARQAGRQVQFSEATRMRRRLPAASA